MTLKQKLEEGYLLGCIKYNGRCNLYFMPIAYWILNYQKYDPGYNPKDWQFVFRNNILKVHDSNIIEFIKAIEVDKISLQEFDKNDIPSLVFFIDFDVKLFVSSFNEIEVEEYLPEIGWEGKFDNPIKYLRSECNFLYVHLRAEN